MWGMLFVSTHVARKLDLLSSTIRIPGPMLGDRVGGGCISRSMLHAQKCPCWPGLYGDTNSGNSFKWPGTTISVYGFCAFFTGARAELFSFWLKDTSKTCVKDLF